MPGQLQHLVDRVSERRTTRHLCRGVAVFVCTSAVVWIGVAFGTEFIEGRSPTTLVLSCCRFDGMHYLDILTKGYSYVPNEPSPIAFFPAYPLVARGVTRLLAIEPSLALVLTSQFFTVASFVVFSAYVDQQLKAASDGEYLSEQRHKRLAEFTLLACAVVPSTFFFRMAYSESFFLFASILSFYGMQRNWRLPVICVIVGLATAIRPVGITLLLPLTMHIWRRSKSPLGFFGRLACLLPFACWGLVAFVVFQFVEFDEPFAFAKTQSEWRMRPKIMFGDKVSAIAAWEPIWSVYDAQSVAYWRRRGVSNPLFNLQFGNPLYFVGTVMLVAFGAWKRWLQSSEVFYSAALLAMPYITRSYEMNMNSHARFAAVVFPVYIVLGRILNCAGPSLATGFLCVSGCLLAMYAALFATGHQFF